jgi:hypothetical protein
MVCEGQGRIRYILDVTLFIAKLVLLHHMPELDRCVLLGARRVIERDVHHLRRGVVNIPVRVENGKLAAPLHHDRKERRSVYEWLVLLRRKG